jgi:hypothetical protein
MPHLSTINSARLPGAIVDVIQQHFLRGVRPIANHQSLQKFEESAPLRELMSWCLKTGDGLAAGGPFGAVSIG